MFQLFIPDKCLENSTQHGARCLSLHDPHLIIQIFKADGSVILIEFSSAADVGEVNVNAAGAACVNEIVEDVNRLTLRFSGHPMYTFIRTQRDGSRDLVAAAQVAAEYQLLTRHRLSRISMKA